MIQLSQHLQPNQLVLCLIEITRHKEFHAVSTTLVNYELSSNNNIIFVGIIKVYITMLPTTN